VRLDVERVRLRRLELGMSQRELARQLGESPLFTRALELGHNQAVLSFATLTDLATALGVPFAALFKDPDGPPRPPSPRVETERLVALLLAAGDRWVPATSLAMQLGIDLDEMENLVENARENLRAVGLSIMSSTNGLDIRLTYDVDLVSTEDREEVLRSVNARVDIEEHVAQLVYRVISGKVIAKGTNASPTGRLLLGRAINAGWIKAPTNETDALELTDAVQESLRLN
jgi:transcriptional regulator with XRE-family HTH domain